MKYLTNAEQNVILKKYKILLQTLKNYIECVTIYHCNYITLCVIIIY